MTLLRSIAMAFLMFSKIPMPHVEWRDESMHYTLAVFPLIGIVIALLLQLWNIICSALGAGPALFSAGLLLIPLGVTGGIHIDGLIDTSDALGSHAEPERKREILKDSRVGAFGVIAVTVYLIAYFALGCEVPQTAAAMGLVGCAHVLSRTTSGAISMLAKGGTERGMLATFRHASSSYKQGALGILAAFLVATFACALALNPVCALVMLALDALTAWYTLHMANREFGGMSGDLAGWFLQMAEILMLVSIVVTLLVIG